MTTPQKLLAQIRAHLARTKESETAFGLAVMNDGHFVRRLSKRENLQMSTFDKVQNAIKPPKPKRKKYVQK